MQINYIDDNSSERLPEPESFDNIFANIGELRELQHIHTAAMMQLRLKFEILNSEFRVHHHRNPIHHIESRLKSTRSMYNKLVQRGFPTSIESAKKNLNDIAGVRVVCCYIDDVYDMEDMLLRQSDVRLIERTDYIKNPNFNGYRSLHLDVEIPVYLSSKTEYARAEIQLRTVAMDFWASLEHDLRYKSTKNIPEDISREMFNCADEIAAIDVRMQRIYKQIQKNRFKSSDSRMLNTFFDNKKSRADTCF